MFFNYVLLFTFIFATTSVVSISRGSSATSHYVESEAGGFHISPLQHQGNFLETKTNASVGKGTFDGYFRFIGHTYSSHTKEIVPIAQNVELTETVLNAAHDYLEDTFGEKDDDEEVIKIFLGPEWRFRNGPVDKQFEMPHETEGWAGLMTPLKKIKNLAGYYKKYTASVEQSYTADDVVALIAAFKTLSADDKYKNWLIAPGTIYWTVPIPGPPAKRSIWRVPSITAADKVYAYDAYNCMPIFWRGKLINFHCKFFDGSDIMTGKGEPHYFNSENLLNGINFPNVPPSTQLKNNPSGLMKVKLTNGKFFTVGIDICKDLGRLYMALFARDDKFKEWKWGDNAEQQARYAPAVASVKNAKLTKFPEFKDGVDIFLHSSAGGPFTSKLSAARKGGYNFFVDGNIAGPGNFLSSELGKIAKKSMYIVPTIDYTPGATEAEPPTPVVDERYSDVPGPLMLAYMKDYNEKGSKSTFEAPLVWIANPGFLDELRENDDVFTALTKAGDDTANVRQEGERLLIKLMSMRFCTWNDLRPAKDAKYPLAYPAAYTYPGGWKETDCDAFDPVSGILKC